MIPMICIASRFAPVIEEHPQRSFAGKIFAGQGAIDEGYMRLRGVLVCIEVAAFQQASLQCPEIVRGNHAKSDFVVFGSGRMSDDDEAGGEIAIANR